MNEKINPKKLSRNIRQNLDNKYDLPKNITRREIVPVEVLKEFKSDLGPNIQFLTELDPDMKYLLEIFQDLPKEMRDYIIKDIKKNKKMGMKDKNLLEHLCTLISKYNQFLSMDTSHSDKTYKPKSSETELEIKEIEKIAARDVGELIQNAENIRQRDNFQPRGSNKYTN